MRHRNKQDKPSSVEKLTFRIFPPYTDLIAQRAKSANLKPNQFARLAAMTLADVDLLGLNKRLTRIEEELIRLRRDFNEAVTE